MRAILMTVMLIIVAIAIYINTIGGQNGTQATVRDSGNVVNQSIRSIDP